MKRTICLVLVTILILSSLAGCAKDSDALIGTWEGEVNYAGYFNQGLQSVAGEALAEYWTVENFPITLILTFREDGTYSMTVDRDKLNHTIVDLKKKLTKGLRDFIQDLIDASESDMSVDDFMSSMDMDMNAMIEEAVGPDIVDALIKDCTYEGNFTAEGGKLYTSASLANSINKSIYENYEITQNTLTLMSIVGGSGNSLLNEALYPITLLRTQ